MMEGFDKFREISDKEFEKLRVMAETNLDLKKNLERYEHISGRNLSESARQAQEENDRRWDIMVADQEKLPKAQQPKTMGAFSDMLLKYGFKLPAPVPPEEQIKEGHFGDFLNAYGTQGFDLLSEYEMKAATEQKPKCEEEMKPATQPKPKCAECRQEAGMRCKQCREHYCSLECQKKAWPSHKKFAN